jgi:hypothetical protein
MLRFAPRLSPRLLEAIARLDDPSLPIAEVCRRVGGEAAEVGLPRPSYERIRVLVHALRSARRHLHRRPSTASILLDVALRVRPPDAVLDHVSGVGVPVSPRPP